MYQTVPDSYGNLFRPRNKDKLRHVLIQEVSEGLKKEQRITAEDISRVVDDVIDFQDDDALDVAVTWHMHDAVLARCVDNRSRSFCDGCDKPWCCTMYRIIELTPADITSLSEHLHLSAADFIERHCKRIVRSGSGLAYVFKKTAPCAFLRDGRLCSVHESKPQVCKNWPLVIDKTGKVTKIRIQYDCNFVFNLLKLEVTLSVLDGLKYAETMTTQ